jgi:lipoprotein-releasing system permease protein
VKEKAGLSAAAASPRGREDRWYLSLLWLTSFGVCAGLWPDRPPWAQVVVWVGIASVVALVGRVLLVGFRGYERVIGLRILRRDRPTRRARAWLLGCVALWTIALSILLALHYGWGDAPAMRDPQLRSGLAWFRLGLVGVVALTTFLGLLLLIGQRFSVFGTTSIIGIVIGVAALLVVQSVATGFQHEFERRVLGVYAHINVTRNWGISEYRRFETWLRTLPGVEGASPFVYYSMGLAPWGGARDDDLLFATVLVKGIAPQTADQVIDVVEHLEHGSGRPIPLDELRSDYRLLPVPDRPADELPPVIAATPDPRGEGWYERALEEWNGEPAAGVDGPVAPLRGFGPPIPDPDAWIDPPAPGEGASAELDIGALPTMFVGVTLADELDLAAGDIVRLVDPGATFDHSEEPQWAYYRIAGVFQAGFQEYDSRLVYVDIKELERFKYRGRDVVSGVDLRLRDPDTAPDVGAAIVEALGDEYTVLEWQKLNENLFSSIRTQKNVITIILSLVIFVASFNVLSALWTMVVRRTPEISIIVSMGATGPQVARIFQVTGMTIGLAGALAGVGFGLMMCWLVELYGYSLDPEVYFIEELPVEISATQIAWILALALAICYVATIPPSLRAAWLRPVEGLRYE